MKKARKLFGVVLAIAMVFNVFAIAAVAENPVSQDVSNVSVNLQVGRYNDVTKVFTPLAPGEEILLNEIITVRVASQSNFYVGAQNIPVMFDKSVFEVQGINRAAFTVNTDEDNILYNDLSGVFSTDVGYAGNYYYDFACTNYAGATEVPDDSWPTTFAAGERYDVYQAIQINFQADSYSRSYGRAQMLPGDWLFQFNLKATQNITSGTDARIFIDNRWFRSPSLPNEKAYITKYATNDVIADQANPTYAYDRDFTGADITLPTQATTSTIIFATGGGTVIAPLTGNIGSPVVAPANPTRTDYLFKGWDTAIPATFPTDDVTVTAQWVMTGDIDMNGAITSQDALRVLRYSTGFNTVWPA